MKKKPSPERPIDLLLREYSACHSNPKNRIIHLITIPLFTFGALGVIWGIPFPHMDFLGRYNGFINWASFFIAFSVYFAYRLSPLLSYGVLLLVFAFSAGIVSLEKLAYKGWPEMWQVCLGVFIVMGLAQSAGHAIEGKMPSLKESVKAFFVGPLWLFFKIFKRA